MTNETRKRIRAYKKALPELRERVIAVALLLAMSVSMLGTASFAWITLSAAPEVTGMQTTVAANGNLEIALATSADAPAESQIGDSSAAENRKMTESNVTWGNLVNLSDPIYGLSDIALRPALLSDLSLTKYPLYGATYGRDGRVVSISERYEYATYTEATDGTKYFGVQKAENPVYGVRAVASVKYENITGNAVYAEMLSDIIWEYGQAKQIYADLLDGVIILDDGTKSTCMNALVGLITIFVQDKVDYMVNDVKTYSDCSDYVHYFYLMLLEFEKILEHEAEALMMLANLQAYLTNNSVGTNLFTDVDTFLGASDATLTGYGIKLNSLNTFRTNLANVRAGIADIKPTADQCKYGDPNNPKVEWPDISDVVYDLVNIDTAELNGVKIGSINGSNISSAIGGGDVVIKEGALKDTEQRLGETMKDHGVEATIRVKYGVSVPVTAKVMTDAKYPYTSGIDMEYADKLNSESQGGDAVAKDTYGMAIDMWLRTNSPDCILTLEGTSEYTEIEAPTKNKNGEDTVIYILSTEEEDIEVYRMGDKWYSVETHVEIDQKTLDAAKEPKVKKIKVVSGYYGENRVWENWEDMLTAQLLEADSTTQGAGSCFVFYADNPSDEARILDLLNSFTVEFVDQGGTRLGTAVLAIDKAYSINGKVTVPLEMNEGPTFIDENREEITGITRLKQNEATWITAIIYLNGMRLQNENVLASGKIQGQLNIQFGNSQGLDAPEDKKLQSVYRTITAVATAGTQTSAGGEEDAGIQFTYDGQAKSVTVTLTVEGEQPEHIRGFFVRAINANQGTRGQTLDFVQNSDGKTWTANFNLTTPGTYLMRNLTVDGVDYTLSAFPKVNISGFTFSVSAEQSAGVHMTNESSYGIDVTAVIEAEEALMPRQVRAQFRGSDNSEYNAILNYDSKTNEWKGTANILSSGTYTLEYLVMDGQYAEVPAEDQKTYILYLGITSQIFTTAETDFTFEGTEDLPVEVIIRDDSGAEMKKLTGAKLIYHSSASDQDQNGMDTDLTWSDELGRYTGVLIMTNAGSYHFHRIAFEDSSMGDIYSSVNPPVFTAIPPVPPSYYADSAKSLHYQFAPDNNAVLRMRLANAEAARVYAEIICMNDNKKTGYAVGEIDTTIPEETVMIDGEESKVYEYVFKIPVDNISGQDGEWQIKNLYFQNVYVDGVLYGVNGDPTKGYKMDVSDKGTHETNGIYSYVVSKVNPVITQKNDKGEYVHYTGQSFTGAFMESYTVSDVVLTLADWKGAPFQGISDVKWTNTYDPATSGKYGGYTGVEYTGAVIALTDQDNKHTTFLLANQTFQFAGEYKSQITFTANENEYTYDGPTHTVSSTKPTVTISGVNPEGDTTAYSGGNIINVTNGKTATTATVSSKCTKNTVSNLNIFNWKEKTVYTYEPVQVEITLGNSGYASAATLPFKDTSDKLTNRLYTSWDTSTNYGLQTETAGTYSWGGSNTELNGCNGSISLYVGYTGSGAALTYSTSIQGISTPAGVITAKELILTYGGKNYTVAVNIVINNNY